MSNITMCRNGNCDLQNTCYRYVKAPAADQEYKEFKFKKKGEKVTCTHQIKINQLPYLVKDRPQRLAHEVFRSESYIISEEKKNRIHNKILRKNYHE